MLYVTLMATRRKKITISIIAAVVVILAANAYFFWPQIATWFRNAPSQFQNQNGPNSDEAFEQQSKQDKLYAKATDAVQEGGVEAGQQVLDQALLEAEGNPEKSVIYQQKSSLATLSPTGGDKQASLTYAYEAEKLDPTYATAILIAEMEQDKEQALKYYKLYLERLDTNTEQLNPGDRQNVEKRIQALEAEL